MKRLMIAGLLAVAGVAQAGEYVCTVYCANGKTQAVVQASSPSDAARKIDPTPVANQICQDARLGNASSKSMGSAQCSSK